MIVSSLIKCCVDQPLFEPPPLSHQIAQVVDIAVGLILLAIGLIANTGLPLVSYLFIGAGAAYSFLTALSLVAQLKAEKCGQRYLIKDAKQQGISQLLATSDPLDLF